MVQVNNRTAGENTYVLDELNALRLWLDAKVADGTFTPQQAVDALRQRETQGKLWTGPVKDALGSARIGIRLAKDFQHLWKAKVDFRPGATGDLVVIKGWPRAREVLTGTRYKVTNPKVMELQIGKPGIRAAAKESARFGIILVVVIDIAEFAASHDLAKLLGSLTVDIPSVILASAIGSAAGTLAAGTLLVGSFAFGPLLFAFGIGVLAGYGLFKLDEAFGITEKVTKMYESALDELQNLWAEAGAATGREYNELQNSRAVRWLGRNTSGARRWLGESMRTMGRGDNAQFMLQTMM